MNKSEATEGRESDSSFRLHPSAFKKAGRPVVEPTRYHRELLDYLRTEQKDIWNWIASQKVREEYAQSVRHELLKTTYRLDPATSAELYQAAQSAADGLGLAAAITLYQAQNATRLNAALAWLPGEAHIVLHGPVQETLTKAELTALFGHELAHHLLFSIDGGAYLMVEQVLAAMLGDRAAAPAFAATWKHFKLYTELFCDRMTLELTHDLAACVSMQVKMETGLKDVNADAYLKQAAEVLAGGETSSEGVTHPEMFIRARALELWQLDPKQADAALESLIQGPRSIGTLDLLRQKRVTQSTRTLIEHFLAPAWIQTGTLLAHAKQFFEDFDTAACSVRNLDELKTVLAAGDDAFRDYFCYILLDFATSDADLDESPFAAALLLARELEIEDRFTGVAGKELRMTKRQFESIRKNAAATVAEAERQPIES
jgi:Zn-dependent protease with chaperone function